MKINWNEIFERIKVFIFSIPGTLKETFSWLLISYLIPIINIGIIWGIKQDEFVYSLEILSIILVTNACFLTSLFYLAFSNKSERKTLNTIAIAFYVLTITLFVVSTVEIIALKDLFPLKIYKSGTILTLVVSVILGLISKYDEQIALSKERAKSSKEKKSTEVGGKNIKI
ncbi:MAG: hypothetical protein NXH73_06585 [Flavobacteriaceae bacterium]|nr:hypothetical protein [Flavobacteriaceae bacterium]